MVERGLSGIEFVAVNTDVIVLERSRADYSMQIGTDKTGGRGAGGDPEKGRAAAEESADKITELLRGTGLVFITAGMGGGTGTGAAPVIAAKARELGILTLGVVTSPFAHEGNDRKDNASKGVRDMKEVVDTLMVIPNSKLGKIYGKLTALDAFKKSDEVIKNAAEAISEIIALVGIVNVDFKDVERVMKDAGYGLIVGGMARGEDKVVQAVKNALENPLLSEIDLAGAKGLLINATSSSDLMMDEYEQINEIITNETGRSGTIITGWRIDDYMEDCLKITVIAAGLSSDEPEVKSQTRPEQKKICIEPVVPEPVPIAVPTHVTSDFKAEKERKLYEEEKDDMFTRIKNAEETTETNLYAKPFTANVEFKQGEPPAFMKKYFNKYPQSLPPF
jgi:cell division protein FtsZ